MLRRLLTAWLVLSILGYGMALAADVHGDLAAHAVQAAGEHASDTADPDAGPPCDHCCHGLLHLLGLTHADPTDVLAGLPRLLAAYSASARSYTAPPPARPPIC